MIDDKSISQDRRIQLAILKQQWAVADKRKAHLGLEYLIHTIGYINYNSVTNINNNSSNANNVFSGMGFYNNYSNQQQQQQRSQGSGLGRCILYWNFYLFFLRYIQYK